MNFKRSIIALSVLSAACVAVAAQADTPNYDFVSLSYQGINDPSGSGFSSDHSYDLAGSYAFTPNLIGGASYEHETADFNVPGFSGTASGNAYQAGIGYRFPVSTSVDIFPSLSYVSVHTSASAPGFSNSVSDTGYDAGVALRAMLTDKWEFDAGFDHSTPGSSSNSVGVGVLYSFAPSFAVGLGYGISTNDGQNTTAWTLTGRFYFGK